jgi:adenylate cyclase class IV
MREIELKSVVDDIANRRKIVEDAGGELQFTGKLIDARYGDQDGRLVLADHVLRLRIYETDEGHKGHLDWKGPTEYESGYKVRDELSTSVGDPHALEAMLTNLGYSVITKIERRIWQYGLAGATVRFEEYPQMDPLVEVEGFPAAIEKAIGVIGLPREGYTADRLTDFVVRFEARTGGAAILSS